MEIVCETQCLKTMFMNIAQGSVFFGLNSTLLVIRVFMLDGVEYIMQKYFL